MPTGGRSAGRLSATKELESIAGDVVNRAIGFSVGVLALGLAASGIASADEPLGPPVVATTFGLGAGPMHDVASDPSTHKAYVHQ